jgi:CelD/BcsL family acetyltransferase involved in cellulose biosynthesis
MAVSIERVTDSAGFRALRDRWNVLLDSSDSGAITLTWEWQFTWWEVFGSDRSLCLLLAFEDGRLIGIAPLHSYAVRRFGIAWRRLAFLASGEAEDDEICSDYLDLIAERGREADVLGAVCAHLTQDAKWDEIVLESVRADAALLRTFERLDRTPAPYEIEHRNECVCVALPGRFDDFLNGLSSKLRSQIRRHTRLLEESGRVEFRRIIEPDEFDTRFRQFVDLHQAWWNVKDRSGCFSSARFLAFHTTLAARLRPHDRVNLHLLTVDERPVAARYSFTYRKVVYEYQGGVDPRFPDSRIGLGVLCTASCFDDAIGRGMERYDFGEGAQRYKLRWNGRRHSTVNVRLLRPSMKSALRGLAERGQRTIRALAGRQSRTPDSMSASTTSRFIR